MDFLICQTSAASPAEPGELLFWFRATKDRAYPYDYDRRFIRQPVNPLKAN
jgi:hypothetical protein